MYKKRQRENTRYWLVSAREGFTQEEVAKMSDISQSYYSQIENGQKQPSVKAAKKIGRALNFDWTNFYCI